MTARGLDFNQLIFLPEPLARRANIEVFSSLTELTGYMD